MDTKDLETVTVLPSLIDPGDPTGQDGSGDEGDLSNQPSNSSDD